MPPAVLLKIIIKAAGVKPNFEVFESLIHGLSSYVPSSGMDGGYSVHQ